MNTEKKLELRAVDDMLRMEKRRYTRNKERLDFYNDYTTGDLSMRISACASFHFVQYLLIGLLATQLLREVSEGALAELIAESVAVKLALAILFWIGYTLFLFHKYSDKRMVFYISRTRRILATQKEFIDELRETKKKLKKELKSNVKEEQV